MLRAGTNLLLKRAFNSSRVVQDGAKALGSMLPACHAFPTVDHQTSVDDAIRMLGHQDSSMLPITKDSRVVGLFSAHDYLESAAVSHMTESKPKLVSEVANMNADQVVAYADESVEDVWEKMNNHNVEALAVLSEDDALLGIVTREQLTEEIFYNDGYSQPTVYPDNITVGTSHVRDEILELAGTAPDHGRKLYDQLKADLNKADEYTPLLDEQDMEKFHLDKSLEDMACASFSESSDFPEQTPMEEVLFVQTFGRAPTNEELASMQQKRMPEPSHGELLDRTPYSATSDYPEASPVEEAAEQALRK